MNRTVIAGVFVILAGVGGLIAGLFLASGSGSLGSAPATNGAKAGGSSASFGKTAAKVDKPKRKILYYWDPMVGPASISPKPGISSMGMALIPVYAPSSGTGTPGEVTVDPAMVQDMGIQTAKVTLGLLQKTIRTVGYLRRVAPIRYAVTLRVSGWIGKLYATTNGIAIKKGDKLFTLYSPELLAAQQELVAAEKSLRANSSQTPDDAPYAAHALITSIENRLRYLGVSAGQITALERTLKPKEYVTFFSPAAGFLANIKVRQKSRVLLGSRVMQIVNLSRVWLDTQVYDNQLPWVRMGQKVTAAIAAFPGRKFMGKIIFIDPNENPENHTTTIRIVLRNASGFLRPGMYALADIHTQPVRHAILIPRRAVINTGTGEITFVEVSHGHFDPVKVITGLTGEHGLVQVLSGVGPGQKVLTSGQFAIDVESQLSAIKARFMPKLPSSKPRDPTPEHSKPGDAIGNGPPG